MCSKLFLIVYQKCVNSQLIIFVMQFSKMNYYGIHILWETLYRFCNIVLFWLILKIEKILKNEKVFIYLQI